MAITREEVQVTWSASNSQTATTLQGFTSDAYTLDTTCVSAAITCKADNSDTTPVAGDIVTFWLLATTGDPDGAGGTEYPTDDNDGQFLCSIDSTGVDPGRVTISIPPTPQKFKIYAYNGGASDSEISCSVEEVRSA